MPETTTRQTDRTQACLRGLRYIYQHSLKGENFEDWAGDYLWCFHCISSTSRDPGLKQLALELGQESARRWMDLEQEFPPLAESGEVAYYVSLLDVASRLGVDNPPLREHVVQGIPRFTARDYLGFDPRVEAPVASPARSRYDMWCDALVLTYTADGFGAPLGARYCDVLRWLPQMRPYRGAEGGANPEFRDITLAITHLVYTLNDYNRYRLSPEWLPEEFEFLKSNIKEPLAAGDPELLGEFVDSLRCFGVEADDGALAGSVDYLLASQHPDGSWGDPGITDPHKQYHTAWTAIDALRDYDWQDRPSWPEAVVKCFAR